MRFNIKAHSSILEIDLLELVFTINSIKTQSTTKKIKTEFEMKKFLEDSRKRLLSTTIRIRVKDFINSLDYESETWRLVERWDWIYLVFSATSWTRRYNYDFFLMNKLDYRFKRTFLFFWKYEIVTDKNALRADTMYSILTNWVSKYTSKSLWTNISLKILWFIIILGGIFAFWISNAFALFK